VLWQRGGWWGVMLGGAVLTGFSLLVWLTQRRRALAMGPEKVCR